MVDTGRPPNRGTETSHASGAAPGEPSRWDAGEYELIADRLAPVHDRIVELLRPRRSERWLDVGTGTGAVALRAARLGADVTGVDISESMLARAEQNAAAAGVGVRWVEASAEALPFPAAAFDVVVSCFGVVFADDHAASARELARVCRPGGRLCVTAWGESESASIVDRHLPPTRKGDDPTAWFRRDTVERLLGGAFRLELAYETWRFEASSATELWSITARGMPPLRRALARLEPARLERLSAEPIASWRRFESGSGVSVPYDFVLITGRRRARG